MNRSEFELRYFFNAVADLEGTEIYHNGQYVGQIPNLVPDDMEKMSDDEFVCLLDENGIIY